MCIRLAQSALRTKSGQDICVRCNEEMLRRLPRGETFDALVAEARAAAPMAGQAFEFQASGFQALVGCPTRPLSVGTRIWTTERGELPDVETIPQAVVAVAAGREATQQCASLTQPIYTAARSKLREDVTICYQDHAFALSFAESCC